VKQIDAVVLEGTLVRLEPLRPGHVAGLTAAVEEDRWPAVKSALSARVAAGGRGTGAGAPLQ
jgi:hypothetical protein